ncbi:MAG: murein DD-endopeptidase MepM/ murein hydrolase activator NlpD [Salibacteraceae bacterium]|jgi:murein DD-endopeptidase MepM/ murein hydrolase activator NlpD
MSKAKYKYNPGTLSYEKEEASFKSKTLTFIGYLASGVVFGGLFLITFLYFFSSPKEKELIRENQQWRLQFGIVNQRIEEMGKVLSNIENRDDNIYRVIFEAEPIPAEIRKAGFGGSDRYKGLMGFDNSDEIAKTTKQLDQLSKQIYIQSKSLDDVYEMARNKAEMLASIPAIMPVAKENLSRVASGYGMRMHPVYKVRKMHTGMDFTAPTGTEINSTGDGVVVEIERKRRGYGNSIIIKHGFGYRTRYAHLSKFNVRVGQKIKRGDVIGYVGNTGTSTGPHLHYEVEKNGSKINPANFYSNDLTPEEYELMLEISSATNQSFD